MISFGISPNGWTDRQIFLDWFTKSFEPTTREKAEGETRYIFLDGHSSHFSFELTSNAKGCNTEIMAYPPHCARALQGLDVVCFAKLKHKWGGVLDEFKDQHM